MRLSEWKTLAAYGRFEQIALACILVMLGFIIAGAIVFTAVTLVDHLVFGEAFLDKSALQDTFGLVLTVVILLEFNHSIYVALTQRTGAIQTRLVVLITVLVIARKLMLQDITMIDFQTLIGFGGLLLALGGLYWLLSDGDRRHAPVKAQEAPPAAEGPKAG
jgi:uncharacterized membrane protein (DUF373 family)